MTDGAPRGSGQNAWHTLARLESQLASVSAEALDRFWPCSFIEMWTRLSAAGVTPGSRLAWPMVTGTDTLQRLPHLPRKPADGAVLNPIWNRDRFRRP